MKAPTLFLASIWVNSFMSGILVASTPAQNTAVAYEQRAALSTQLQSIILPIVQFQDVTAEEAVEFFQTYLRGCKDENAMGVNVILKLPDDEKKSLRSISLNLKDIPLGEAMRYLAEMSGLIMRIEPHAVTITSETYLSAVLTTRVYQVPPNFLTAQGASK
jgi:general secretion pathway protein D